MVLSQGPGDEHDNPAIWNADTTLRKEDYFNEYLDGTQSPNDIEHEPDLGHLLSKLYERQRAESYHLLDEAVDQFHPEGENIEKLKIHKEEFRDAFHEECGRFAEERDRYIREYHEAKKVAADLNEQSQKETLDLDMGHGPKSTP